MVSISRETIHQNSPNEALLCCFSLKHTQLPAVVRGTRVSRYLPPIDGVLGSAAWKNACRQLAVGSLHRADLCSASDGAAANCTQIVPVAVVSLQPTENKPKRKFSA
jgi:hypothetical protein